MRLSVQWLGYLVRNVLSEPCLYFESKPGACQGFSEALPRPSLVADMGEPGLSPVKAPITCMFSQPCTSNCAHVCRDEHVLLVRVISIVLSEHITCIHVTFMQP